MRCFIVGAGQEESRRLTLTRIAETLGFTTLGLSTLAALRADRNFTEATRPLVLFASTASEPVPASAIIAFAQEHHGHAFVVFVADSIGIEDYKALVRTGSAEWIKWQSCELEFGDLAAKLIGLESTERTAKILSFVPSKGGVGNTMLVIETAIHLVSRRRRGKTRVAILDLNLQGGSLADALDIEPRFDIAEIVGRPERLDEQLIDVFTSRHASGIDVFAGPVRQIGPDEVGPQLIFTFIDTISSRYDAILFDLPQHWLPWTDNLIQGSDAVVVTGSGNVPALRRLSAKLAHLDALAIPETRLATVLNQSDVDIFGRVPRRDKIERALPGRRLFFVRRDNAGVDEAADVGRPLLEMMPNSGVGRDIRRLGEWIGTITDQPLAAGPEQKVKRGEAA